MATYAYASRNNTSQRGLAMVLALVAAGVLSPLYVRRKNETRYYEMKLSSGFVLPMVLAGLIVAIRTTSSPSSSSMRSGGGASVIPSPDPSWVLRIGGLIMGTRWYFGDACACVVMARICARVVLQIDHDFLFTLLPCSTF